MLKSGNSRPLSHLRSSLKSKDSSERRLKLSGPQEPVKKPSPERPRVTPISSVRDRLSLPQISITPPEASSDKRFLRKPPNPNANTGLSRFGDPRFRHGKKPTAGARLPLQPPDSPPEQLENLKPLGDRFPRKVTNREVRERPRKGTNREVRERLKSNASRSTSKSSPQKNTKSAKVTKTQPRSKPRPQPKSPIKPLVYLTRLLIWGVGMSAISGTVLAVWNPAGHSPGNIERSQPQSPQDSRPSIELPLAQEIGSLKTSIETVTAKHPQLTPGVFLVDVDTGDYLNLNGKQTFAAASTIKVPILVAFFQAVDAGQVQLDETLTLKSNQIVGGSGNFQDDPPGTTYTALEVATATIVTSDNTATNMLIERLGGIDSLNLMFQNWGLTDTALQSPLPDLTGTNITTPQDLTRLISSIERGELISRRSRDRLLDIMQATENNALLPQGLGTGASIAHKTGTLNSVLADVGIVDLPSGKRYIAVVIVKRTDSDEGAVDMIRQISSTAYEHFNRFEMSPQTAQTLPMSPAASESWANSTQQAWTQEPQSE